MYKFVGRKDGRREEGSGGIGEKERKIRKEIVRNGEKKDLNGESEMKRRREGI